MKKLSKKMSARIEALSADLVDQNIDEIILALKRGVAVYAIQDLHELDADEAENLNMTANDSAYVRSEGAGALGPRTGGY